jgi:hypothetical protein
MADVAILYSECLYYCFREAHPDINKNTSGVNKPEKVTLI